MRARALEVAAASVQSWGTITVAVLSALLPVAAGVVWGLQPPEPEWWPLGERWWLPGGWGTASSMIGSGGIALGLLAYSSGRFRRGPDLETRLPQPRRARPSADQRT